MDMFYKVLEDTKGVRHWLNVYMASYYGVESIEGVSK